MISVKRLAAQGDILFRRIDRLPNDVEQKVTERLVVGHSETGHHHVIDEASVRFFEKVDRDPFICFLSVDGDFADVVHLRPYDTHETLRLSPGLWEIRRQREWVPEGLFVQLAQD